MTETPARTPVHFWIVGIIALLWNLFGAVDYFMTRTQGAAYIKSVMPTIDADRFMAYIDGFPLWASIGWGLGVWCGLAGAVLLLVRRRLAVPAFALSLIGAVLGIGYQLLNPVDLPAATEGANAVIPYVIILAALLELLYARSMSAKGVLR